MMTGLIRRDGRYSTRKVIPLDLRAHYGRREIVRALGTADPARAKKAHLAMWQMLETEFEEKLMDLKARYELDPAAMTAAVPTEFARECEPLVPMQEKLIELMRRGPTKP